MVSNHSQSHEAQTLSPIMMVEMLAPRWRFDSLYAAECLAYDVYVHAQRAALCLEFTHEGKVLTLEVRPEDEGPAAAKAWGLSISHERSGDESSRRAKALCDQVADDLRAHGSPETEVPTWVCPFAIDTELPGMLAEEVQVAVSSAPVEGQLIRDMKHYEALYQSHPVAREIRVHDRPVGMSVYYPAPNGGMVPASAAIYQAPARVRRRRILRLHFASLGCAFDAEGMPRTVPSPATLRSVLQSRQEKLVPLRWVERRLGPMQAPEWVRYLLRERALPVTLAPRLMVHAHRALRRVLPSSRIPVDVGMLVHDASVHGLVFSDIDAALWDEFARQAESILRRRPRSAAAVARFYEEDLTQACWQTWRSVDDPTQFAERFDDEVDGLRDKLRSCAT